MIIRIVKLEFEQNQVENFLAEFEDCKLNIRNFDGCEKLNLLQDKNNKNIFFTYSYWQNENCLENYRNSPLFKSIWKKTKAKFKEKAKAWTVENTYLIK